MLSIAHYGSPSFTFASYINSVYPFVRTFNFPSEIFILINIPRKFLILTQVNHACELISVSTFNRRIQAKKFILCASFQTNQLWISVPSHGLFQTESASCNCSELRSHSSLLCASKNSASTFLDVSSILSTIIRPFMERSIKLICSAKFL